MGVLSTILNKVFGGKKDIPHPVQATAPAEAPPASVEASPADEPAPPTESFDVEAHLSELAKKADEKLDWKVSIVDLMKLVGMDSSLAARRKLAKELNYTGDTSDSAKMNLCSTNR